MAEKVSIRISMQAANKLFQLAQVDARDGVIAYLEDRQTIDASDISTPAATPQGPVSDRLPVLHSNSLEPDSPCWLVVQTNTKGVLELRGYHRNSTHIEQMDVIIE